MKKGETFDIDWEQPALLFFRQPLKTPFSSTAFFCTHIFGELAVSLFFAVGYFIFSFH